MEKLKGRELFEKIAQVTKNKEVKTQTEKVVKLMEEAGEFAAGFLQSRNLKGRGNKTDKDVRDNLLEEACDCVIILKSILTAEGFSYDEYLHKMSEKLSKWEDTAAKIAKNKKD